MLKQILFTMALVGIVGGGAVQSQVHRSSTSDTPLSLSQPSSELVQAIENGDLDTIKAAVSERSKANMRLKPPKSLLPDIVEVKPESYPTLLMCASYYGQETIAEWLIKRGAMVNADGFDEVVTKEDVDSGYCRSVAHLTALHLAASQGHTAILKMLLQHGAKVNAEDENGWSALRWAVVGNAGIEAMTLLLQHGAAIDARAQDGSTVLMFAISEGRLNHVHWLLHHKSDVNARAKDGTTALKLAAHYGDASLYQLLKAAGARGHEPLRTINGLQP